MSSLSSWCKLNNKGRIREEALAVDKYVNIILRTLKRTEGAFLFLLVVESLQIAWGTGL